MQLAKVKLEQLLQHGELLERYGASVRVLGQRDLIRPDVLEVMDRAVKSTAHNDKYAFLSLLLAKPSDNLLQSHLEHLLPLHF